MAIDFISGKHVTTKVYMATAPGGQALPWAIKCKSVRVQELANEITDHVCGEDRARAQKLIDLYRVTCDCYEDGSSALLENWLANQANEDANLPQLALAAGLVFRYLDGSAGAFTLSGCTLGPLDVNVAGRTERVMDQVVFRAQYFKKTAAV